MIIIIIMWAVTPVTSAKPPSIFSTQDREHLATDEASLVFIHLKDFKQCHSLRSPDCFNILYHAPPIIK